MGGGNFGKKVHLIREGKKGSAIIRKKPKIKNLNLHPLVGSRKKKGESLKKGKRPTRGRL